MTDTLHFVAFLDAMRWLAYHRSLRLVNMLGKEKKRVFSLDRSFCVHSLALVQDPDTAKLFLAIRDEKTTKWFAKLNWQKIQVFNRKPAFLNLICDEIDFPAMPELKFEGGSLPAFSLKIPIYSKLVQSLTKSDTLYLGSYKTGETIEKMVLVEDRSEEGVPIEIHG